MLDEGVVAIRNEQQLPEGYEAKSRDGDVLRAPRLLPFAAQQVKASPRQLHNIHGYDQPEECPPDLGQLEWGSLQVEGTWPHEQKWVSRDEEQPTQEEEAKHHLRHRRCEAARFLARCRFLLESGKFAGTPGPREAAHWGTLFRIAGGGKLDDGEDECDPCGYRYEHAGTAKHRFNDGGACGFAHGKYDCADSGVNDGCPEQRQAH